MWVTKFDVRAASIYLATWALANERLDAAKHKKYKPTIADCEAYVQAHGVP